MVNEDTSNINIEELSNIQVFASPDQQLTLGHLWKNQTAILVFLRHFACIACRAHASQVWGEREKYQKSGAKVVFIGNGQPNWIEKFREDLGIDKGVVLTDPSLRSFEAAGFKKGFFTLLQPQSAVNAAKLLMAGHSQKAANKDSGSHFQMGGILAINTQNKPIYHYVSEALGDIPEEPYLAIIREDEAVLPDQKIGE